MLNQSRRVLALCGVVATALMAGACCDDNNSTPTNPSTTCTFTAGQPSVNSFPPEGGTGTVQVTTASTCAWTATSGSTFITITQGASGTGNGTVNFTVAANTGTADRTGTMTIGGSAVTITQRGATSQPPPTQVTLSAPSANSPVGGVTVTTSRPTLVVNNATSTGNAGTVTYRFEISDQSSFPNDPVRTFTADGVAQGSGTTSWVLTRDLGPSVLWYWRARATNGTVTSDFSNVETFRTAGTCSFAVSPTSVSAPTGGGTFSVNVTTDAACSWTAASQSDFITITSGASGTGNGTVTFSVAAASGSRTGTLTVAGQTVTVSQAASGISASFRLLDPGRLGSAPTTDCQIRSLTSTPTTCTLESTSFPTGATTITGYSW